METPDGDYTKSVQIKFIVTLRSGALIERIIDIPRDDPALTVRYGVLVTRSATYMSEGYSSGPLQA